MNQQLFSGTRLKCSNSYFVLWATVNQTLWKRTTKWSSTVFAIVLLWVQLCRALIWKSPATFGTQIGSPVFNHWKPSCYHNFTQATNSLVNSFQLAYQKFRWWLRSIWLSLWVGSLPQTPTLTIADDRPLTEVHTAWGSHRLTVPWLGVVTVSRDCESWLWLCVRERCTGTSPLSAVIIRNLFTKSPDLRLASWSSWPWNLNLSPMDHHQLGPGGGIPPTKRAKLDTSGKVKRLRGRWPRGTIKKRGGAVGTTTCRP